MKTLYIFCLLLAFVLTASTYARSAPTLLATPQPLATTKLGQVALLRYRYLRDTELPQLLAWLQDWGPFTQPPPGQLPPDAASAMLADQ